MIDMNGPGPDPDPAVDRLGPGGPDPGPVTAVPLVEENVQVSTREVVTGRVRVRTVVDTSEHLVQQDLDTEHVTVTRVPVDRYVDAAPAIRTEGDVTIIPVMEEVLVVETRLLLKEEVHITRRLTREAVEHHVTLRKQRAVVDDDEAEIAAPTP